jgi:hypothetical protein
MRLRIDSHDWESILIRDALHSNDPNMNASTQICVLSLACFLLKMFRQASDVVIAHGSPLVFVSDSPGFCDDRSQGRQGHRVRLVQVCVVANVQIWVLTSSNSIPFEANCLPRKNISGFAGQHMLAEKFWSPNLRRKFDQAHAPMFETQQQLGTGLV